MEALVTSCGRTDLLRITLDSLLCTNRFPLNIKVHEDAPPSIDCASIIEYGNDIQVEYTGGLGQHPSIEKYIRERSHRTALKYYLHLEDDWQFEYGKFYWIQDCIRLMETDPSIIKVLVNSDSPHLNYQVKQIGGVMCDVLQPWSGNDGIIWHGFSWNPGITRFDLLKQFIPFPKWEQELAEGIYKQGYKVVRLRTGVCHHIGQGRSTHE